MSRTVTDRNANQVAPRGHQARAWRRRAGGVALALCFGAAMIIGEVVMMRGGAAANQSILVLVNDHPISEFDIKQRVRLKMISSGQIGRRIQASLKAPDVNDRFRKFAMKHKPKSRAEIEKLKKRFVQQVRRQVERSIAPKLREVALRELINEALQLQEAERLSVSVSSDQVSQAITSLAKRNEKTYDQFKDGLSRSGVNIMTIRQQYKAALSWRQVVRRRYGRWVSISQKDIDEVITRNTGDDGDTTTELKLQRVTFALPGKIDQRIMAERFEAAQKLRDAFRGCDATRGLAKSFEGAAYSDLGLKRISDMAEEVRPVLLSAEPVEMTPPVFTASGLEVYAVCAKREIAGGSEERQQARRKLQSEQLEAYSRRLLRDLCNEAFIEYRNAKPDSQRCGA